MLIPIPLAENAIQFSQCVSSENLTEHGDKFVLISFFFVKITHLSPNLPVRWKCEARAKNIDEAWDDWVTSLATPLQFARGQNAEQARLTQTLVTQANKMKTLPLSRIVWGRSFPLPPQWRLWYRPCCWVGTRYFVDWPCAKIPL